MNRVDLVRQRFVEWLGLGRGVEKPADEIDQDDVAGRKFASNTTSIVDENRDIARPEPSDEGLLAAALYPQMPAGMAEAVIGLTRLLDAIPEPTMLIDATGVVLHRNALVVDLFPRAAAGHQLTLVTRAPELLAGVERVLNTHDRVVVELVDRVPVRRRISAVVTRVIGGRDGAGVPAVLVTFRDLTDQDRHNQMRADFVANASHELRTPLASLRGFIETIQGPARVDRVARDRFIAMMAHEAGRMSRLIDDLLTLSRAEMRTHLVPRDAVNLNELADAVAHSLALMAEQDGITIHVAPLTGHATVRGDRDELLQVLQNLVQNGIKYGRHGGCVEIRIERFPPVLGEHRLAISVIDD